MTGLLLNLRGIYNKPISATAPAFDPATLFANGENGAWYDPSDLTTMWTDTAGTIQATVNDPVARMDDKSGNGNHVTQATLADRPVLRQSGGLYYLEFDGAGDFLGHNIVPALSICAAVSSTASQTGYRGIFATGGIMMLKRTTQPYWGTFASGIYSSGTILGATPNVISMNGTTGGDFRTDGALDGTYSNVQGQQRGIGGEGGQRSAINFYGLVAIDRNYSTSEIEDTEGYLANKAGVTL